MKILNLRSLAVTLALGTLPSAGLANSLTVSPTSIKAPASAQTATVTVRSGNQGIAHGQVRVYRSTKVGRGEQLSATRDVVVSPPAFRLSGNQETTFRLMRQSNAPVKGQECYRVLIDQLPDPSQKGVAVNFTIRHSIPLCFGAS